MGQIASDPSKYYELLDTTILSDIFQDIYNETACGRTGTTAEIFCCPLGQTPVDTDNDTIVDSCDSCSMDNVCNTTCTTDPDCDDWKSVSNISGDQIDYIITGTIAPGST